MDETSRSYERHKNSVSPENKQKQHVTQTNYNQTVKRQREYVKHIEEKGFSTHGKNQCN